MPKKWTSLDDYMKSAPPGEDVTKVLGIATPDGVIIVDLINQDDNFAKAVIEIGNVLGKYTTDSVEGIELLTYVMTLVVASHMKGRTDGDRQLVAQAIAKSLFNGIPEVWKRLDNPKAQWPPRGEK